jgi:hypothetical protein
MARGVEFTNNFAVVKGRLREGMEQNVRQAAAMLEGQIKRKLGTGARTGHEYKVPGTKNKTYTASAPGEAPAVMLSNYMNSITHDVAVKPNEIVGTTGTNQKQGKRLEFGFVGTDSLGRRYNQAPRPHMKVTYEENKDALKNKLNQRIDV